MRRMEKTVFVIMLKKYTLSSLSICTDIGGFYHIYANGEYC